MADEFFVPLGQRSDAAMDQFTPEELEVVRRYLAVTSAAMAAHRQSLAHQGAGNPAPHVRRLTAVC